MSRFNFTFVYQTFFWCMFGLYRVSSNFQNEYIIFLQSETLKILIRLAPFESHCKKWSSAEHNIFESATLKFSRICLGFVFDALGYVFLLLLLFFAIRPSPQGSRSTLITQVSVDDFSLYQFHVEFAMVSRPFVLWLLFQKMTCITFPFKGLKRFSDFLLPPILILVFVCLITFYNLLAKVERCFKTECLPKPAPRTFQGILRFSTQDQPLNFLVCEFLFTKPAIYIYI